MNILLHFISCFSAEYIQLKADPSGCAVYGMGLGHSLAEIVGLNPVGGVDVCLL